MNIEAITFHSAFGIRHSAFGIRHSAFGIRHSAFGIKMHLSRKAPVKPKIDAKKIPPGLAGDTYINREMHDGRERHSIRPLPLNPIVFVENSAQTALVTTCCSIVSIRGENRDYLSVQDLEQ